MWHFLQRLPVASRIANSCKGHPQVATAALGSLLGIEQLANTGDVNKTSFQSLIDEQKKLFTSSNKKRPATNVFNSEAQPPRPANPGAAGAPKKIRLMSNRAKHVMSVRAQHVRTGTKRVDTCGFCGEAGHRSTSCAVKKQCGIPFKSHDELRSFTVELMHSDGCYPAAPLPPALVTKPILINLPTATKRSW